MIYQGTLTQNAPTTAVALDFVARALTVVNPTPYPLYVLSGSLDMPVQGRQSYIVTAGTTMTVPTGPQRLWSFRLVITGTPPTDMTPAMFFFTQDETPPSVISIGVAAVSYAYAVWGKDISGSSVTIQGTTWLAIDDTVCFLDVDAPNKRLLLGLNTRIAMPNVTETRLIALGVYDPVDNATYEFCRIQKADANQYYGGTMSGVVEFNNPGSRRIYLRAREPVAGSGYTIHATRNWWAVRG